MNSRKITEDDIADIRVSSLPTRPTAPTAFGGKGYTANELKAAFDRLPLYIIDCFNKLIDDITGVGGNVTDSIKTDISEAQTLKAVLDGIKNGNLSTYLITPGGLSLAERLSNISESIASLAERLESLEVGTV